MMLRTFVLVAMSYVLVLCPILLAAGVQTLTIDSQLGTSIEDCFERITIGEQLPSTAIYRNVSELTTRECEQICKQDKQCQTYDYGVGAKGNATCNLSKLGDKELAMKLQRHPDYDVYIRRINCEQSAPNPITPQNDEPGGSPIHRPVFRPVDEEPKKPEDTGPLSDEFIRPNDLRPYASYYRPGPFRPNYNNYYGIAYDTPYRPHNSYRPHLPISNHIDFDRPDDYVNQKPDFDMHQSYGAHHPQDPHPLPQRPNKPQSVQSYNNNRRKPDPYDVLNFQTPNVRPPMQAYKPPINNDGLWRPDPYMPHSPLDDDVHDTYGIRPTQPNRYPTRPSRPSEGINHHYYSYRPNKNPTYLNQVPKPHEDFGYTPMKPVQSVTQNNPFQGYGVSNTNQDANSYDFSVQSNRPIDDISYNDNPTKPNYRPTYSYNSQYASGYAPGSHHSTENSIYLEINDPPTLNKPSVNIPTQHTHDYSNHHFNNRPDYHFNQIHGTSSQYHGPSPTYASMPNHNYGQEDNYIENQPPKPVVGSQNLPYGGQHSPWHYQSSHGHDSHHLIDYSSRPQTTYNKPSFNYGSLSDYEHGNYGSYSGQYSASGSVTGNQGTYGTRPTATIQSSQGNSQSPNFSGYYGSQSNSDDRPDQSYNSEPSSGSNDEGYKNTVSTRPNKDSGYKPPIKVSEYYGYGSNKPEHGNSKPGSNNQLPENQNNRPSYNNRIKDTNKKPSFNDSTTLKPDYDKTYRPDIRPVYEYDVDRPNAPSYIVRPNGQVITSRPVAISDYGKRRPASERDPGVNMQNLACFRRVLAGKRALRSHVRRVVPCERLEDCRLECAIERRFHCESFNYKLDPSFRGKGLCELMTKPIEAFDLQRDFVEDKEFDFYEIDRNSLEPYCPETLRGPGLLHSGFLSSKPDNWFGEQKWDRYDSWQQRVPNRDDFDRRYFDDRIDHRNYGGRRRYEEQNYIPYQIGVGRSNDDQETWGQYGGSYGGYNTYYKDGNDYRNSLNHWRLNPPKIDTTDSFYGVKPHGTYGPPQDFDYNNLGRKYDDGSWDKAYGYGKRGQWNNSGQNTNGLSYGESNYYRPARPHHPIQPVERNEPPVIKDCSSRRRPGMSLSSGAIRRSLLAQNVVECEAACFNERDFKCVSYSYRYSNSRGSDNCFLSERPYRGLDLASDSGSDVYAMPQDHGCAVSQKPWVESECFWHVRSESAVSDVAVKAALTVAGLGACEAECIRAHGFFCRGFSFRFDSPAIGDDLENCLLTSSPPTTLEPGNGLRKTPGHELYARGNYGRGCEPALYDELHHREKQCYLQYDNAAKLIGAAIKGQARVKDEEACGVACTDAPFRCLSFSYNNAAPPEIDNCLLSEIRLFDLQRGVDYEHSSDDWLFAFDLFNGQCWRKVHGQGDYEHPTHEHPRPLIPTSPDVPVSGPPSGTGYLPTAPAGPGYLPDHRNERPSGPSYIPISGPSGGPGYKPGYVPSGPPEPHKPYKPSYPVQPSDHGFKPAYPPPAPGYVPEEPAYRPGFVPSRPEYHPSYPLSSHVGPGYPNEPGYRPGPPPVKPSGPGSRPDPGYGDKGIEEPIVVSWRHYTVSGLPCRQGTTCAQNQVGSHWACEPEGGEIGSWDYCCTPSHRCGYSEGFHKPWCYVGPSSEQWRPCSEKYYPYHQHNVPHPSQGHRREDRPCPQAGYAPAGPFYERPGTSSYVPLEEDRRKPVFVSGPYLPEADRKYWDDLYKNGPKAYYDDYGNPLPGYIRIPTSSRPHIKYHHNYGPRPGASRWEPISALDADEGLDPPVPGGLGVPRYWPVAYLHKGPPPNITYFKYNETDRSSTTTTTERNANRSPNFMPLEPQTSYNASPEDVWINGIRVEGRKNHTFESNKNVTSEGNDTLKINVSEIYTTPKLEIKEVVTDKNDKIMKSNASSETIPTSKAEIVKMESSEVKGIDGKLDDFSGSIEILDIEDAKKGDKQPDLKTLEAEERQIEAIGRLLASRRSGQLVLEKRSQKDLEAKSIAVDKDLIDDFNFGNRFPTSERRGTIQKISKDEIQAERDRNNDKSLEVSETTFVRPPRVLSTTENIRKTLINGKVFYDATIREQRDLFPTNNSRKVGKTSYGRILEDTKGPSILSSQNFGKKKNIRPRNVNPVRRVRRIYRKRYNPEEVRKRLLERDRTLKQESMDESIVKYKS